MGWRSQTYGSATCCEELGIAAPHVNCFGATQDAAAVGADLRAARREWPLASRVCLLRAAGSEIRPYRPANHFAPIRSRKWDRTGGHPSHSKRFVRSHPDDLLKICEIGGIRCFNFWAKSNFRAIGMNPRAGSPANWLRTLFESHLDRSERLCLCP